MQSFHSPSDITGTIPCLVVPGPFFPPCHRPVDLTSQVEPPVDVDVDISGAQGTIAVADRGEGKVTISLATHIVVLAFFADQDGVIMDLLCLQ